MSIIFVHVLLYVCGYHIILVLVFGMEDIVYEFSEGEQSQGIGVTLKSGNVGKFTVSLAATTDDPCSTSNATGTYI